MGAFFSPWTAEGGSISSGRPRRWRDASRRRLRTPMPESRPTPDSSPDSAGASTRRRRLQRPELLGGVGAAGELGEILCAHHGARLAHLFGHPCVDRVHELFE